MRVILLLFITLFFAAGCVVQFRARRRAERSLADAKNEIHTRESKIQTILNNAPVVFSAVDARGIFQISEGKGLEKLGRKSNQSVGLSIFEMHGQNPIIIDAVTRALAGEHVSTAFTLNGISYELFMGPERNTEGRVTGASMLSVDVTERKQIESERAQLEIRTQAALATAKLKSEFLAMMSHEIRTPINGVIGLTALLLETKLDSQQKEFATGIHESGKGLLSVINDILDFSKIEAGKIQFEKISFDLPELILHSLKGPRILAGEKGIELRIELPESLPTWVCGDPGRFRQILINLVGNAIKFTQKGEVTVRAFEKSAGVLRFEVSDTGVGISSDHIDQLFVAFSQADASMSRRFGGTGLGLSISKQLVEKWGGKIGAASVLGEGSTFWFELPLERAEPEASERSSLVLEHAAGNISGARILLAEDNKINQVIASRMLEKMGFQVETVADGNEALEALHARDFDIVLMDCQMPNKDGLEATLEFRAESSGRNSGIPIIAMTANAMEGDREKCLATGMDDYVSKPVPYGVLNTTIMRWLQKTKALESKNPSG